MAQNRLCLQFHMGEIITFEVDTCKYCIKGYIITVVTSIWYLVILYPLFTALISTAQYRKENLIDSLDSHQPKLWQTYGVALRKLKY